LKYVVSVVVCYVCRFVVVFYVVWFGYVGGRLSVGGVRLVCSEWGGGCLLVKFYCCYFVKVMLVWVV